MLDGLLGDAVGAEWAVAAASLTALATFPLVLALALRLVLATALGE